MKYNKRDIMNRAWKNFRKGGISFSEALHRAWISEKAKPENESRIKAAAAAAGVVEQFDTWAGWKEQGREVQHGSKAAFTAVLIYGSKGDGATYKASFFTEGQTIPA